jgi:hypothetical protein
MTCSQLSHAHVPNMSHVPYMSRIGGGEVRIMACERARSIYGTFMGNLWDMGRRGGKDHDV